MKKFICATLITCVMCFGLCSCAESSYVHSEEPQVAIGRFISDYPSCYIITDSETGVQYIYCKASYSGGMTLLVNADGTPYIADGYEK